MGVLNSSRADLAAFPLSLVEKRPEGADFTHCIANGGIGVLVKPFTPPSSLSSLLPFYLNRCTFLNMVFRACMPITHATPTVMAWTDVVVHSINLYVL